MKKALVTGITGQDGSYLSELLLEKGYQVCGIDRRIAIEDARQRYSRIYHILDRIKLYSGDIQNYARMFEIINEIKPDECYHLAAQSFVGTSFEDEFTVLRTNIEGTVNVLNILRKIVPDCRYYFAGSSEMFGKVLETPQNENTPFNPMSPYAISKCAGFRFTKLYREAYDMFACSGILFNHECISPKNVIMVKKNGFIKICYVQDIKLQHGEYSTQTYDIRDRNMEIMTSEGFKKLLTITIRSKHAVRDARMRCIETRNGFMQITNEHNCLNDEGKILAKDVKIGHELKTCEFKSSFEEVEVSDDMARFLGYMVADGSIYIVDGYYQSKYAKNDDALRRKVSELAKKLFMFLTSEGLSQSGFSSKKVKYSSFKNCPQEVLKYLYSLIYHKDGKKKVPEIILNSSKETMKTFFDAYYEGDGLKKDKCKYKYKAVKSNSPILLQGLYYISKVALELDSLFYSFFQNGFRYYCLNFNKKNSKRGKHLLKNKKEVRKNYEIDEERWVYDIETENGEFQLGIGNIVVSNSPRRGGEFVTRKIAKGVAEIKYSLRKKIKLGNLKAKRDWGYASDYVKGMHLMLQQPKPDDYVLATGETHTVKEFVKVAFEIIDIKNWQDYIEIDQKFMRPAEVNLLLGDASKAKRVLGWEPKISFKELVKRMVEFELKKLGQEG